MKARMLRKNATLAEQRLWETLRGNSTGYKFRRQSPIGRYIADFVCFEARIIVELDGYSHAPASTITKFPTIDFSQHTPKRR
jgi:very-short-patch-repair endonuclease